MAATGYPVHPLVGFGSPVSVDSPRRVPEPPSGLELAVPEPLPGLIMPETYIVQVPKDQIYRVPPPENAILVEQYRRERDKARRSRRCPPCVASALKCLVVAFILGVLLLGGILAAFYTVKPSPPGFTVDRLTPVKTHGGKAAEYEIAVTAENENPLVGFAYGKGGKAALSFGKTDVARGTVAGGKLYQPAKSRAKLSSSLRTVGGGAPKEMNASASVVALSLTMELPLRERFGMLEKGWSLSTECHLRVTGLATAPPAPVRIVSQDCSSELRP